MKDPQTLEANASNTKMTGALNTATPSLTGPMQEPQEMNETNMTFKPEKTTENEGQPGSNSKLLRRFGVMSPKDRIRTLKDIKRKKEQKQLDEQNK